MSSSVKSLDRAVNERKAGDGGWVMREWGQPQSDTVQGVLLYQSGVHIHKDRGPAA